MPRNMNAQVAVLCDAATDDRRKLNLLGSFDTIMAPQLPAVHPQCSIALRITFMAEDEGQHPMRLCFVDADGKNVMPPMDIPVNIALPDDSHFVTRNFIVNIQQMKFAQAGVYSIDVFVGERLLIGIPLMVKHSPPSPPPVEGDEWKTEAG